MEEAKTEMKNKIKIKKGQVEIIPACPLKSGWQDSNLRPPGPKPGAIPGYATSRTFKPLLYHLALMHLCIFTIGNDVII